MKRMKNYILTAMMMAAVVCGCNDEDTPKPVWEYPGPNPEIANGPAEAQKMCYNLYQKYDLHVYYTLNGDEALITEVGSTQTNPIIGNNSEAIPMQAADEATAEKFLKLLTDFYGILPEGLPAQDLHKRHILVKINPANNSYMTEAGDSYWFNTFTEDQQAVIYYGYLDSSEDSGDKFDTNLKDWKWGICYEFFRGLSYATYKKKALPAQFGLISKGLYSAENETGENISVDFDYDYYMYVFYPETGKKCGFVHPLGAQAGSDYVMADWGSYVAWILMEPKAGRVNDLNMYERLRQKYDLVIQYYKDTFKIDLEELAVKWQAI